jgi:hypothetical protein
MLPFIPIKKKEINKFAITVKTIVYKVYVIRNLTKVSVLRK